MNICGITEQMPVNNEAVRIIWMLGAVAMHKSESTKRAKLVTIIFLRLYISASGTTNNNPKA